MRIGLTSLNVRLWVIRIAPYFSKRLVRECLPLALLTAVACRNEPSATTLVEEQKRIARDEPAAAAADEPSKQVVLTREKLDRYLTYQKQMVQLYARVIEEAKKPSSAGRDAQRRRAELTAERRTALEELAVQEERARARSGLSLEELRRVEQLIREVIGKRIYGAAVPEEDAVQRMEEMKAKLPREWQQETEKSISEIRHSQEEVRLLAAERARFGSANVEMVLSRERELSQAWKETMALFATAPKR